MSVFVDESGRFQCPDIASRFYIISLVLHDQSSKIDEAVRGLDTSFRAMHLNNVCFHAGPLIRQEKVYAVLDWEFRYRIFAAMMAFARKADFKYHCLIVDKKFCNNLPMTDSEYTLFGGPRKFKRSILKFIKQKEI